MLRSPLSSPLKRPLQSPLAARRGGVPDPAPPVNVSLPSIIGTPAVGSEVTANQGGWTGYPSISYAYQWRRDGVNISGATSQAYTIQAADYETSLTVVVSATNTEGGPVTATSPAVSVIGVAPVNTVAPVVSGSSGFGDVLTTTNGTWTGYPASFSYAYQWQRNGSNIGGATASTYTIVAGDSAASITCVVTATNAEGSTAQASNGITAQTFSAPVISGVPTISGTAEVGQLLTASAASVTGNPSPSRTWQWLRDGSNISGATSSTYTLVSADGGTDVSVRQTETNALGTDDSVSAVVEVPVSGFDPATFFASGEQGGWYDPSDFSTMFQDTAGTVPVTAVGQAVARINDKSGRGNHATQETLASRPLLSARVNLMSKTEQFNDGAWTKAQGTITATTETSPIGTPTANVLTQTAGQTTLARVFINNVVPSAPASTSFICSVYAKKGEKDFLAIGTDATAAAGSNSYSFFNIANGSLGAAASGHSLSIADAGNGWYRCTLTATTRASVQNMTYYIGHADTSGSLTVTSSGSTYIWGADLRAANDGVDLPVYQRVNTATDYDTAGFPLYLNFDGVDDGMSTASIDFTATDKMTVLAGVRKLSDSAEGSVTELSASLASNNGTLRLTAPEGAAATFGFTSKGTAAAIASVGSIASPATRVLTATADIAGNFARIDVNGADGTPATTNQGSGNFGNYPMFIGSRNNATLRFNGRIYSLIVRGAASTAGEITDAEAWVNGKTGAF